MPRPRRASAPEPGSAAAATAGDPLRVYRERRDFRATPEPGADAGAAAKADAGSFVVQKHHARRLHYDFRLEWQGVLLSWAVPKGPSLDPGVKRMAVRTEDHPLAYGSFEGTIPPGHYGAGEVIVWDRGHWTPHGDAQAGLAAGKLGFDLHGHKLAGSWELVRLKGSGEREQEAWLLFKKRDAQARLQAEFDVVQALPDSVLSARPVPVPVPVPAAAAPPAQPAAPAPPTRAKSNATAPATTPATTPLPETLSPQLATLAQAVPEQGHWIYEDKLDGYRLLARIERGTPRLFTRNGHDWSERMPELLAELAALKLSDAWLDGEIVVADAEGRPDFHALQTAFDKGRTQAIVYRVFDLLYLHDQDLRTVPLLARRELLQALLQARSAGGQRLQLSELLGQGAGSLAPALLQAACKARREGLIAKRADAPYAGVRNAAWLKLKCQQRQEFVVAGYTQRSDDTQAIGSLVLGVYDETGGLQPAGKVGTGWSQAQARALGALLAPLATGRPPFAQRTAGAAGAAERGVRPVKVAEVSFAEWTPAGRIRHAVFIGLREDKPARQIARERALPARAAVRAAASVSTTQAPQAEAAGSRRASPPPARKARAQAAPHGVKLTHPDRVIDAASGLTKQDLARYLEGVADWLLPELAGRPVALLRAPQGVGGQQFFQKHAAGSGLPGARVLDAALWPGHEPLIEMATPEALAGAAQFNVLEFHTWNSRVRSMAKPDRLVFDLDPGEGVDWPSICEGVQLVRGLLQELGLQSWLKTSGGKGLHVVVPMAARWPFAVVKGFTQAVVRHLAAVIPQRFVAKSGPANRRGRIFVDYLRNGEGATTVAAYSPRARPGLGVSMPVAWDELPGLRGSDHWTAATAAAHIASRAADPWAEMRLPASRQNVGAAMKRLGYRPER